MKAQLSNAAGLMVLLVSACVPDGSSSFEPDTLGGGAADGYTQTAVVLGMLWYGDRIEVGETPEALQNYAFSASDEPCETPEMWRCAFSTRWNAPVSQVCRGGTWNTFNISPQDCGACAAGNVEGCRNNPNAVNVGYEFPGAAGAQVELDFVTQEPAVVVVYGPKRGLTWSDAEPWAWARADEATLGTTLPEDGTYLALVRREDTAQLPRNFQLGLSCLEAPCWIEEDIVDTSYAVGYVREGSNLNVRTEPGTTSDVLRQLPHDARGLFMSGEVAGQGRDLWLELSDGGWVSRRYLVEDVGNACEGSAVLSEWAAMQASPIVDAFVQAVAWGRSEQVATVASPIHGIDFVFMNGETVSYDAAQIAGLFEDGTSHRWGETFEDENSYPIEGTFSQVMVPALRGVLVDRFESLQWSCGASIFGQGLGDRYANLDYLSLNILPVDGMGAPDEVLIGFEHVDGRPTISVVSYMSTH